MQFNKILNQYMNLIGCNSKELAKEAKLSESIISRYKNGNRIPSENNLKKISKALEKLSDYKYTNVSDRFYESIDKDNIDFKIVINNINKIIDSININVSEVAKYLNFDPSHLSKIRKGTRNPSNKQKFVCSFIDYVLKKYNDKENKVKLSDVLKCDVKEITTDKLKSWVLFHIEDTNTEINSFLKKLDEFNLNDYIKAIKFDELKIPTIPFYRCKSKNYYGIEEMKCGELDFFKATVIGKSKEDIFMCSDMPMEDMAKDIDFGKKWMFAIAMSLKKGLHLNIIHNLNRPFNEMMLGLESWIPIYMTGQISPYYFKDYNDKYYCHLNYVSGVCALVGECVKGYHNKGKYYLTSTKNEVSFYHEKAKLLLSKSSPLMNIYTKNEKEEFKKTISNSFNGQNIKRIFSSLPLFTIENDTLINILKRNKISIEDINTIINYKNEEEQYIKNTLVNSKLNDVIFKVSKKEFDKEEISLSLENIFYEKKITYTYLEYEKHLKNTINWASKYSNYTVTFNEYKTFKNINIVIIKNCYVKLSKCSNPTIHFIIKHPKLVEAISKFDPIVKE